MPALKWSEAYTIFVPEIDAEHRMLFRLADRLRRAIIADAAALPLQSMFGELITHTTQHFVHEERTMRSAGYPQYDWHKRQHAMARATALQLKRRIHRGDREGALDLLDHLAAWLKNHIRLSDRMLGAYLRNYERQRSAHAS